MNPILKHIKTILGLFFKGAVLLYFACFFLGKNVVTELLSFDNNDCELYEELEAEDAEEENELDDKEHEAKLKEFSELLAQSEKGDFFLVEASNSDISYKGFQREIPDPPPEV